MLLEPEVFKALRQTSDSPQERGRIFERVMRTALERNPQYSDRFKRVWLWTDWPQRIKLGYGVDSGVDLVAEEVGGRVCAIQCKLYAPGATVPSSDINSFLAEAGKEPFTSSLLVTTGRLTAQSWNKVERATKRCEVLSGYELDRWPVRWAECFEDPSSVEFGERAEPRRDQVEALESIAKGFDVHPRGQVHMPCGTGKSLVALWAAEQQVGRGGRVLYLVPSIALMAQTMRVWAANRALPHRYSATCSDVTAGRRASATKSDHAELLSPPSTDREQIAKTLQSPLSGQAMHVWFCTYQSVPVLSQALSESVPEVEFDLIVCDEAHRTTGIGAAAKDAHASAFMMVHSDEHIGAAKRLYQTATPRVFTERQRRKIEERAGEGLGAGGNSYSMDDESVFGPVFYEMSFVEAIERELVSDYRVLVVGVNEREAAMHGAGRRVTEITASDRARKAKVDSDYATKLLGCWDAMATPQSRVRIGGTVAGEVPAGSEHRHLRTAIAFTNTVRSSQACSEDAYFADEGLEGRLWESIAGDVRAANPGRTYLGIEVDHVDGTTRAVARSEALASLERQSRDTTGPPRCRVISNAQLFTEGVDVPALDAVVFLEPRRSPVQVTQAVGRAMRKAEGKDFGYVVIPVIVPEGSKMTDSEVLDGSDFKTVWEVVRALRSHDERVDYWVNDPRVGSPIIIQPNRPDDPEVLTDSDLAEQGDLQLQFVRRLEDAVASKVVEECGDRQMWPTWGQRAADVCVRVERRMAGLIAEPSCGAAFDMFVAAMREAVGAQLTAAEAQQMVAHHVVTIPVFDHLFAESRFAARNPISRAINSFLDALAAAHAASTTNPEASSADRVFGELLAPLARSYRTMQRMLESTHTSAEKVDLLRQIYEGFFAYAMKETVARLGIVYTPVEIVDFMLRSADAVCRKHFGHGVTAESVHVLDPFAGTGTFLHRLLTGCRSSGDPLVGEADLLRKFAGDCRHGQPAACDGEGSHAECSPPEIHANEIVLLAYYIAALKIEAGAAERGVGTEYRRYRGIVFGDTYGSGVRQDSIPGFDDNSARARAQSRLPIRVIVANPPWSAGQRSSGDDNPRPEHPEIEQRIRDTYGRRHKEITGRGAGPSSGNLYVEAFRWACDRLDAPAGDRSRPGIVALVHPNSLSNAPSLIGMRAALREEFSDIYVVNLLGDAMKSGDEYRREGDKVFGQGSRNGVQITVLVRDPADVLAQTARLHYATVPEHSTLEAKFGWLADIGDVTSDRFTRVPVNDAHDWVNLTDGSFEDLLPVCAVGPIPQRGNTVISDHARGLATSCDAYVYAFSYDRLAAKVSALIDAYGHAGHRLAQGASFEDATRNDELETIKWTHTLKQSLRKGEDIVFDESRIREVLYRPFTKIWLYEDHRILSQAKATAELFRADEKVAGGGKQSAWRRPTTEPSSAQWRHERSRTSAQSGPTNQPASSQGGDRVDRPVEHGGLRDAGHLRASRPAPDGTRSVEQGHASPEAILVSTPSTRTNFAVLATDTLPDLHALDPAGRAIPRKRPK
ncbi:MAG: DEAD/DEAH box helicase family protein [Acidimicrobiaceae bacterium]|nr:DEAD/DEAH box helicase family protein [Acidimicrobiaceae bacterium]